MDFHVPGPVALAYGAIANPATAIGVAKAGITISSQMIWTPVHSDIFGNAPVDWIFGGRNVTISCIISNITAFVANFFRGDIGAMPVANIGAVDEAVVINGTQALEITERDGSSIWIAPCAIPLDPSELLLRATTEMEVPLIFKLLPGKTAGKVGALFDTIPAYIRTAE